MRRNKTFKVKPISVKLNRKQLERDVFVKGERILVATLTPIVQQKIERDQEAMLEEFEDHPVTVEISGGNEADNSSGLLGGYGNLFAFIGFDEGEDPIEPIADILRSRIAFRINRSGGVGNYTVTYNVPAKEEIFSKAQVGWMGGRSWLDGIEKGISGLDRFLYDPEGYRTSRSFTGLQAKGKIVSSQFQNTKYVSEILNNFRKRLQGNSL